MIAAGVVQIFEAAKSSSGSVLHQLPPPVELVGRETELADLEASLCRREASGATISSAHAGLQGMGGIGKTALAEALAHRLKVRYPDAQLFVNLRGADPAKRPPASPAEVMQTVIHSFRPEARLPEAADELAPIYRSVLADGERRILLLYDNAADAAQVRALLPPPNCLLLVTSRQRFALPGLITRDLDCLEPAKSRELLLRLAPRLGEHAAEAAELCGHLPLALEVFAGTANDRKLFSIPSLLQRLRTRQERLAPVEAAFETSFDLLPEPVRRPWTLLAVFPASFDLPAAAAAWEQSEEATREILQNLVNANLVEWNETTTRFRLHDLARQSCESRLSAADRDAALLRYARHFVGVGAAADRLYLQGGENVVRGLELFDRERIHIESAFDWLHSRHDPESSTLLAQVADAVVYVGSLRFHPRQQIGWLEAQRDACRRIGDRSGEGNALGNLGNAHAALGDARKAIVFYEQRIAIAREIGDRRGEGADLGNLGNAHAALGDARKAIGFYEQALVIDREIGDRRGEGADLGNLGNAHVDLGDARRAIGFYEQQLVIVREIGDRQGEGSVLGNLGVAHAALGDARRAISFYEQQLVIVREIGDRRSEGAALGNLGLVHAALGDARKAIDSYEQRIAIAREIGDRRGEGTALGNLGNAHAALGDARKAIELYEQALVIDREIGDRRGEGTTLFNSARLLHTTGDRERAIARAKAALAIFEAIESPHTAKTRAMLARWRPD